MPDSRPNVLIILSDDLGWFDVGCYHQGIMGSRTPNIDRIASEGVRLTDCYAQASCTAGRAALITGQLPMRTGLTTVGMPGASQGIQPEDPTLAELLKPQGYMTTQIGKNHLGDRNEFLPTVHGFDEFYGNLYHLNAEEEPEQADYPRDQPAMQFFKPRGVLDCKASDDDDPSEDARFGRVGKQVNEDTGPLTRKRMERIEDDLLARSLDFIDRAHATGKPFLLWHNTTRMHVWTHLSERWKDKTKYGLYADGLQELDWVVGELLGKLDELGIAEDTIVVFTTDNGAEKFSWPDGGTSPFRGRRGSAGRAASACRSSCAGRDASRRGRCSMASSRSRTSSRPSWPPPASPTSRNSYCRATRPATSTSASIWTATTSFPISKVRPTNRCGTSSSTTGSTSCTRSATGTGRSISRSRTTGSRASRCGRPCPGRSTSVSTRSSSTWTRPTIRSMWARSSGRSCPAGYILQQHAATFGEFPPRQAPANFNPQEMLGSVLNAAAKGIGNT